MPNDTPSYDMPVKIKGVFTTGVPTANLQDNAVLFNWVSWNDPRSSNPAEPDIFSVGCEVTYHTSAASVVRVNNYKGKKSFLNSEHNWANLALSAVNANIRAGYRANEIDYYAEF